MLVGTRTFAIAALAFTIFGAALGIAVETLLDKPPPEIKFCSIDSTELHNELVRVRGDLISCKHELDRILEKSWPEDDADQ